MRKIGIWLAAFLLSSQMSVAADIIDPPEFLPESAPESAPASLSEFGKTSGPAAGITKKIIDKKTRDSETLRKIEQSLNAIHTMKSVFIQRAPDGSVAEGMLYLKRPGKLRFDFGKDAPFLVVSNGRLLTFVDYAVKQVSRWPIKKTPLGILVDDEVKFDTSLNIPHISYFAGLVKVSIIDPKRQEYGHIILIFEESTMALRSWESVDAQGYITRVSLVNPEYNIAIDDKYFTFIDPRPSKHGPHTH